MPDYTKGKIYSVRSHKTDLIYIGSTIQPLSVRIGTHRTDYNNYLKNGKYNCKSIEIFKLDPNPYIELIINYSCNSKDELRKEEGKWIRKMKCVNKNIAGRTKKEYYDDNKERLKEQKKEYYNNNKDKIKEYYKEYNEKNKDKIKEYYNNNKDKIKEYYKEYHKEYKEKNKDKIKEYHKEQQKKYREDNKDKIKEYYNKIIKCPICNLELKRNNLNYHQKKKCEKINCED